MTEHSFTRVSKLLHSFKARAEEEEKVRTSISREIWGAIVGEELARHTKVTQSNGHLHIEADGSIWAHAISQKKSQIMELLAGKKINVSYIEVKIKPANYPNEKLIANSIKPNMTIDYKSSKLLSDTASGLKSKTLARALEKLSTHRKTK